MLSVGLNGNDKLEEIWKDATVSEAPSQRVLGSTEQNYKKKKKTSIRITALLAEILIESLSEHMLKALSVGSARLVTGCCDKFMKNIMDNFELKWHINDRLLIGVDIE